MLSRQTAWWKLRVWDKADVASDWSDVAFWEKGLATSDWQATWLAASTVSQGIPGAQWIWFAEGSWRRARLRASDELSLEAPL